MAKKSMIAKNEQRKVIVARYATKRLELKKALVDPTSTDEQREEARLGLQKLPRNASPVRVRGQFVRLPHDCCGHRGELPGITKSSW